MRDRVEAIVGAEDVRSKSPLDGRTASPQFAALVKSSSWDDVVGSSDCKTQD
jgi:hypothetical protein